MIIRRRISPKGSRKPIEHTYIPNKMVGLLDTSHGFEDCSRIILVPTISSEHNESYMRLVATNRHYTEPPKSQHQGCQRVLTWPQEKSKQRSTIPNCRLQLLIGFPFSLPVFLFLVLASNLLLPDCTIILFLFFSLLRGLDTQSGSNHPACRGSGLLWPPLLSFSI